MLSLPMTSWTISVGYQSSKMTWLLSAIFLLPIKMAKPGQERKGDEGPSMLPLWFQGLYPSPPHSICSAQSCGNKQHAGSILGDGRCQAKRDRNSSSSCLAASVNSKAYMEDRETGIFKGGFQISSGGKSALRQDLATDLVKLLLEILKDSCSEPCAI